MLAPVVGASAETRTVRDETGPEQSNLANRLKNATIQYADSKMVWRVKLEHVSRKKTRVFAGVWFPDGDSTRVWTLHRDGEKVVRGRSFVGDDGFMFGSGITAKWDTGRDVITITMTSDSPGWTHPLNARAYFEAYTVEKGAMHGPHCPIDENTGQIEPCNDDYVFIRRLRKG